MSPSSWNPRACFASRVEWAVSTVPGMVCYLPLLPCLACLRSSPTLKDGQSSPNTHSGDIPAWKGHQEAPGPHPNPHSLCRFFFSNFQVKMSFLSAGLSVSLPVLLPAHPLECEIHVGDLGACPGAGGWNRRPLTPIPPMPGTGAGG